MSYIHELQEQDTITLAEALNASQQLVEKYLPMLHRVMQIRATTPVSEDEQTFRSAQSSKSAVPQLYEMLERFGQAVSNLQAVLIRADQLAAEEEQRLDAQIYEKLLNMLDAAVQHCNNIYAEHSTTFAMILKELVLLNDTLHLKLKVGNWGVVEADSGDSVVTNNPENTPELVVNSDEKLVFVRVFYRKMATLNSGKGHLHWLKPLLDSVKHAEKHGFAVYEHEADAIKSLKGDAYGYVTLKIKSTQDISAQRPSKVDPVLGCRLLTIADVDIDDMVKLTHQSVTYRICDGVLHKV
ncbi:MAG: hypothetical protein HKM04_04535 [Legionellales bacterium]|nr:hypothetical protein [Legionellales bacterium]